MYVDQMADWETRILKHDVCSTDTKVPAKKQGTSCLDALAGDSRSDSLNLYLSCVCCNVNLDVYSMWNATRDWL
jgi:hypothetical protein